MTTIPSIQKCFYIIFFVSLTANLNAGEPAFKSQLFKKGTLVYSDNFDKDYDKERWGPEKRDRQMKDGLLVFTAMFKNAQEAEKALGRDHHLGLSPLAHINKMPKKFVCHMRFKFEAEAIIPGRPVVQIGHHMNILNFKKGGGYHLKLTGDQRYSDTQSGMALNQWVDMVIEFKEGKMLLQVNGHPKIYEHEQVSMKTSDRFTFKTLEGPKSRLLFDYVRLWEVKE